jgi:hypothetical protein
MNFLFAQYPQLSGAVVDHQKDLVTCATPAGRCFFLRGDNLCQIEVDHGRAKKPGVCLLFPFNDVYRIGETVAVAPHFICPLRLRLPAAPDEVAGSHAKIGEAIRETAMLDPGYVQLFINDAKLPPDVTAQEALAREVAFRDLCSSSLGHRRFTETVEESSVDSAGLRSFCARVAIVMKWRPPTHSARDPMDDTLLVLASSLRMELLDHSSEALLRFLAVAELLVRNAFSIGIAQATLQGVHSLIEEFRPSIRLLAWGDQLPALKKVRLKSPNFGDPRLIAAAEVFLNNLTTDGVLPALEKALQPLTAAERSAVLRQLSSVIDRATPKAKG